ncbi:MAG: AAA family ATPase [Lachnospiraceae bacterium]|nr:AAA family ATPase [Lachnospiraceae bacterium]
MKKRIYTGYEEIDKEIGGLCSGEVTLIGGKPSMGKTALALKIALNVAKSGKSVTFFSAESSPVENELRLASMISGIPYYNIWKWNLTDEEWDLLKITMRDIKKLPIRFLYTETIQQMKYACDNITQTNDLIVYDCLQLIRYKLTEIKDSTQELTPNDYSKEFKRLARKYNAAVIVTSQLARKLDRRKDKHPKISDLRIENPYSADYDQAFLIYRESLYDLDAPNDSAEMTIVCLKKDLKETYMLSWNVDKCLFE